MNRTVAIMSAASGATEEKGRITWDGSDIVFDSDDPDFEDYIVDGMDADDPTPEDGETFLDAVLDEYDGTYVWAEEVKDGAV